MNLTRLEIGLVSRDWFIVGCVCTVQLFLIVLPNLVASMAVSVIAVLTLALVVVLASSLSNTVLFLIVVSAVIPNPISQEHLLLPMGFKFGEGIFAVVMVLVVLTGLLDGRRPQRTPLDRPMVWFLGIVVFSCLLGFYYGQSTSQMLRDVRFPLYYSLYFVVKRFFPVRRSGTFLYVIVAVSAIVGIEYLVTFFSEVNLSISGQFTRVARPAGLLLPIGTLLVACTWLYAPRSGVRVACTVALIPISLAFVLTVGRGMWISAIVGLGAVAFLYIKDPDRQGLKGLGAIAAVPCVILLLGTGFQALTGTGVGAQVTARLSRIQTYEEDHSISGRLVSYQAALVKIVRRPVLGAGHGETVSFYDLNATTPGVTKLGAVDNLYLTLLLRMGIVGLVAFVWLYGRSLRVAYRLFRSTGDPDVRFFAAAFFTVYASLLFYSVADPTLITTRLIFIHATALGVLGLLVAEERV